MPGGWEIMERLSEAPEWDRRARSLEDSQPQAAPLSSQSTLTSNVIYKNNTNVNVSGEGYGIPDFLPKNRQDSAALEIAERLSDQKNLKFHIKAVHCIGEETARAKLATVMNTQDSEIKKSRASFYAYLVKLDPRWRGARR